MAGWPDGRMDGQMDGRTDGYGGRDTDRDFQSVRLTPTPPQTLVAELVAHVSLGGITQIPKGGM